MEAGPNAEYNPQEINKTDIKVEDFFVNEQSNIANMNNVKDEETNNDNNSADAFNIQIKSENIKTEENSCHELKENGDEVKYPEIKYSKIPEFDKDNKINKKNMNNKSTNGTKSKNKKIVFDKDEGEEEKVNLEENKEQDGNLLDKDLLLNESGNNKSNGKKITNSRKPKKEKIEKLKIENISSENNIYDPSIVVDLEEIKNKEKIENADVILCLIEICTNSSKYGLTNSNKSRLFWDELFKKRDIAVVFKNFKSETLRKYWRLINELNKYEKVIETVKNYEEQINKENVKLLTVINAICDSIKGKPKSLENYFSTISSTQAKKSTNNGKKNLTKRKRKRDNDDSSDSLINDLIVINKNIEKSKKENLEGEEAQESAAEHLENDGEEEEEDEYDDLESDDEPFKINSIDILNDKQANKRRLTRTQIAMINKKIKPTEKEKKAFIALDALLEVFGGNFTNFTNDQILDIFEKNSFDYHKSYLQMVDPGIFESKCFTEPDDYIIKNLKDTEYYEELLSRKGEDAVKLRHTFLNIESEY